MTTKNLKQGWKKVTGKGYEAMILSFNEGSEYGINEGRISKLWIKANGEVVCYYDRGWDMEPSTHEACRIFSEIIAKFN